MNLSNLAAGTYAAVVTDNVTGCKDTVSFTIDNQAVSATVNITPHNVICAGASNGYVEFDVVAGPRVSACRLPIRSMMPTGRCSSRAGLPAGQYFLAITDAGVLSLAGENFSCLRTDGPGCPVG